MDWLNKISPAALLKWLLLLFFPLFIPYSALCHYAHPSADDFTYNPSWHFWDTYLQLYLHWNGRYTANFFIVSNPILVNSLMWYRLSALILLLLIPVSVFFFISSATGKMLSTQQKAIMAIIVSVLILNLLPVLPQGIYWYPGSVTYILGCITALFYIGTVLLFYKNEFLINSVFHSCLCVMLLFLVIGFNEVQMFLLLFFHLIAWLNTRKTNKWISFPFIMLLFCMAFSSIMIFSKGNHGRNSCFHDNHHFFNSLIMTSMQMPRFFFNWVSYAPLLLASILFAPLSFKLGKRSLLFQRIGNYNPVILFSFLWVILFLCIFPPYWSTAILGQQRTLNTACFYFVITWFVFLHSLYSRKNLAEKIARILTRPAQIMLTLLLASSLFFSGNSGGILMDFATGKITGFDKEMSHRYELLAAAKKQGLKSVSLPAIQNKPNSLFVLDIEPGSNYWMNQQYAEFFGLEKVYMDSTAISH